jgi:hypothetical protein
MDPLIFFSANAVIFVFALRIAPESFLLAPEAEYLVYVPPPLSVASILVADN